METLTKSHNIFTLISLKSLFNVNISIPFCSKHKKIWRTPLHYSPYLANTFWNIHWIIHALFFLLVPISLLSDLASLWDNTALQRSSKGSDTFVSIQRIWIMYAIYCCSWRRNWLKLTYWAFWFRAFAVLWLAQTQKLSLWGAISTSCMSLDYCYFYIELLRNECWLAFLLGSFGIILNFLDYVLAITSNKIGYFYSKFVKCFLLKNYNV